MKPEEILNRLLENGFEALYVGGAVRDEIMGLEPDDIDITTSASPEEVKALFPDASVEFVGANFGVTLVDGIEVAMFRTETYDVVSKPTVAKADSFLEDASRRDFTFNALAKDKDGNIIDHFGGRDDIHFKQVQCIGNPQERFEEDPSRILRAFYFAARFKFRIQSGTFFYITNNLHLLDKVPNELKGKIIQKVIKYNCLSRFVWQLGMAGGLHYVFPELEHTIHLKQNPKYHDSDVFYHTIRVIRAVEGFYPRNTVMLLAGLLHDNRKGIEGIRGENAEGQPNDLGHEEAGEKPAYDACIRLGFGKDIAKDVGFIVRFHGIRLPANPKKKSINKLVKKMMPYMKNKEELLAQVDSVFDFMLLDAEGFTYEFKKKIIPEIACCAMATKAILKSTIFFPHELPIDGQYLISKGFKGKEIGEVMQKLIGLNLKTKEEVDAYFERREGVTHE